MVDGFCGAVGSSNGINCGGRAGYYITPGKYTFEIGGAGLVIGDDCSPGGCL
jgi:hypothetical protein